MAIKIETLEKSIPVYDITVQDNHNFYANGILVHNCSEITLPTGLDYNGKYRTAVCCLSHLNLEKMDEWKNDDLFIHDIMEFLDNALTDFIESAPPEFHKAVYSAKMERSVGLGVMGFHSYLQQQNIPWESAVAKSINMKIFKHIKEKASNASGLLALQRGACPDAIEYTKQTGKEYMERFSYKTAIAPTATTSTLCGQPSAGIEPYPANAYKLKVMVGDLMAKNKHLEKLLESKGHNNSATWLSIHQNKGSVAHLDCLTPHEKDVYKTALEIDPKWLVDFAADRTPYIDQSQSLNIFLPSNTHKRDLHSLHFNGWKKGLKSFYYCRSTTAQQAFTLPNSLSEVRKMEEKPEEDPALFTQLVDECVACQ